MAQFSLGITWEENKISKLNHGKLMNDIMRDMGYAHKLRHLPKHFEACPETSVGGAYGYEARSIRWQKRKAREGKPLIANVYTGKMRENVLRNAKVAATQTRATIRVSNLLQLKFNAAPKIQRNGSSGGGDRLVGNITKRRREIEAVSDGEVKFLANRVGKNYANLSKSEKYKRKRRVKLSG